MQFENISIVNDFNVRHQPRNNNNNDNNNNNKKNNN